MPLIMSIQGLGLMGRPMQSVAFPRAEIKSPDAVRGDLANLVNAPSTFRIFRTQLKPASIGVNCSIRLCTMAQSLGMPLERSVMVFSSTPNGVGMVIGDGRGITEHPFGFFGGSIFCGTVAIFLAQMLLVAPGSTQRPAILMLAPSMVRDPTA